MAHVQSFQTYVPRLGSKVVVGLAIGGAIAWLAPFDMAFAALTLGSPPLRAVAMVVLALIGLHFAGKVGLGVEPQRLKRPLLTPMAISAGVASWCVLVDLGFRSALHAGYVAGIEHQSLVERIAIYGLRAFNENILYRLFLSSTLIWLIAKVWRDRDGRPAEGAYWLGFILAQSANVWINVTAAAPVTAVAAVHDVARYLLPGLVWSGVYWRYGFQSNEIASTSVHLFFQPLISLGFAAVRA